MNDSRKGSQQPTLLHEPPDAVDWRLSEVALEWARDVAGYDLDEWQQELVRWTFARRSDGLWAARDVGGEVARQNGKNIWLEAVELVSLCEFGDRLIIHSAHRADVSQEHFLSMKARIEENDELASMMPASRSNSGFVSANGKEAIHFASGARLLFKARAKASGRGPRPQKVVFDEALVLEESQVGSMAPGISAQRNPQLLFASSPPKSDSSVLHGLRARAKKRQLGDRLYYAAWNNPSDTKPDDEDAWFRVNPSLGRGRMTVTSLMANRFLMAEAEFMREHLGVPEDPVEDGGVVPLDLWASLAGEFYITSHRQLALDISADRRFAAFAVAGRLEDGRLYVEVGDHKPNGGWVLDRAAGLAEKWGVPVRVEKSSPAGALIPQLVERGVEVVEVSAVEHAQAVGQFIDAALNDGLRHNGGSALSNALKGAVLRPSSDAVLWSRRSSKVDICPLVAVTVALGGVPTFGDYPVLESVW